MPSKLTVRNTVERIEDDGSHLENRKKKGKMSKKLLLVSILLDFSLAQSQDVIAAWMSFATNF